MDASPLLQGPPHPEALCQQGVAVGQVSADESCGLQLDVGVGPGQVRRAFSQGLADLAGIVAKLMVDWGGQKGEWRVSESHQRVT